MKRESVLKQLAELKTMTMAELKEKWRSLYDTAPPQYNRAFLEKRLAYRIQELAYGGISQSTRERMDQILEAAGYDENAMPLNKKKKRQDNLPVVGTRLIRKWKGGRYEVNVVHGGFEFEGRMYHSLTAIAEEITGTHWNGPAFFGLRDKNKSKVKK